MKGNTTSRAIRSVGFLAGTALLCGALAAPAAAQEVQGAIVVSRDVPERYAFLPGAGEPLIVKTAPFGEVWGGINPGKVLSNAEADDVVGQRSLASQSRHGVDPTLAIGGDHAVLSSNSADRSTSFATGIGGIVGQALDSGLGSLQTSLDQVQSALGSP